MILASNGVTILNSKGYKAPVDPLNLYRI